MNGMIMQLAESRDFAGLFDYELGALQERACFPLTLSDLKKKRDIVIEKASSLSFEKGHIPFLPAIPRTQFNADSIVWQIQMIKVGNESGRTIILPKSITDLEQVPNEPYWMFDVEDGTETLDMNPWLAHAKITEKGRLPLTTTEIITLSAITDILSSHPIIAPGSRFNGVQIPELNTENNRPLLRLVSYGAYGAKCYSPSCMSRIAK